LHENPKTTKVNSSKQNLSKSDKQISKGKKELKNKNLKIPYPEDLNFNSLTSTAEKEKYVTPEKNIANIVSSSDKKEKTIKFSITKKLNMNKKFEDMFSNNQINKINIKKNNTTDNKNGLTNAESNDNNLEINGKATNEFLSKKRKKPICESKKTCIEDNSREITNAVKTKTKSNLDTKNMADESQKVLKSDEIIYKTVNFNIDKIAEKSSELFKNVEENFNKPLEFLQKHCKSSDSKISNEKETNLWEIGKISFDRSLRNEYAKTLNFINNFNYDSKAASLQKDSEKYDEDQTHFIKKKQSTANIKRKCGVSYVKQSESLQLNVEDKYE